MKTILVPTDFSDAAYNAAQYALQLAGQISATRVVLYHAYELIVPIPDLPTAVPMVDVDELRLSSLDGLQKMETELAPYIPAGCELVSRADNHLLAANINEVAAAEHTDFIVMGIIGGSNLEEILVGSNTVDVVKNTQYPVFVVPIEASFKPIKKVVFACDLKRVVETTPMKKLTAILDLLKPELIVANVHPEGKEISGAQPMEGLVLDTFLAPYNPDYRFVENSNVVNGIIDFATSENADLILVVPRKHGFFDSIFKRSNTSRLAFKTSIPLLSLHQ
ncbi:nucleotide-binding universal stress UspA family protein [Chitinophaga skermanii]|uniref:Nucleotide-binding universal stress UspA family protein n=1 Tax=Chitinophaga skermanii TaxID=331697 RepID=A0A327R3P5_9BACT|nr:universal stress protein [Chitinophaga skermanii]RAJ10404.1 nucleotide-binding universal stress UspA family protein [Chitinophaga skermanii]